MSNPTSNFGWQMPTPTDLVTDLPADFEVFGQAVDSTMADLKGGTSGQILSKNSNTDMDFVWTSPNPGDITGVTAGTGISGGGTSGDVTITNSMATAIDAKGDLIAGTGADAFARLAAGTNFAFLQTDSTQSTGIKWNYDDYTSYTPVISATTGAITSYTSSGAYTRIGKTCIYRGTFTITNNGTGAGQIRCSVPFTSFNYASGMVGAGRDTGLTGKMVQVFVGGNDGNANLWFYDNSYPGGTGATIGFSLTYQVA